jgi:tRNA wybutosine-synthesizing protein 2
MYKRPVERIKMAANNLNVEILNQRVIKKYSPGVYHVVIDAKIGR